MKRNEWECILNQTTKVSDIYHFIGLEIAQSVPNTVVILIQNVNNFKKAFVVDIVGLKPDFAYRIIKLFGLNPVGKVFNQTSLGDSSLFQASCFTRFEGTLHEFSGNQFPKWACMTFEFFFGKRDVYTIGINYQNRPMGFVMLITTRKRLENDSFKNLELKIRLASERLYKLMLEDEIISNYPQLKKKVADSLLNNINHEIRSPLNHIVGLLHLSNHTETSNEFKEEMIQDVWLSANHLTQTIDRLIELSELEAGLVKFDMAPTSVNEIADILRHCVAQKSLCYNSRDYLFTNSCLMHSNRKILTDKTHFERICNELIDNAYKFSDGEVHVSIDLNEKLRILIADSGVGIPNDVQKKIFENFEKLPPKNNQYYQGIGLGLSITSQILKRHEGSLTLQSQPSQGAKFCLDLPLLPY
jgi:signal transduction histidine kinase